jgi:kynurenine formamidase
MALPPEFHELAKKVNNWGRWGVDDERGTLNLITPDVVRRGIACARTGTTFLLAIPLSEDGPQTGAIPGRTNPARTMTAINKPLVDPSGHCYSDDVVSMGLQAGTHWDSLVHVSYDGRLWNGFDATTVDDRGAARAGIDKVGVLAGRGILLDVARAKRVERLDGGYGITPDDLDAAASIAGLSIGSGDILLVRTGHMQLLKTGERKAYGNPSPGLTLATSLWFHERDVAAVATDTLTFEVFPSERKDALVPVHLLNITEMGLTQGQNFDLEQLSADCAADGVYEFFLTATPEPFVRGLGGPVAPVAIK